LQDAAKSAELTGYTAEMYQFLRGNESGFSYEDLCSNHVGAMLFCNNYQEMVNWGLSWGDMLSNACASLNFTEPENAPNYDFIPHIIDGNLPRVYSSKDCLFGDNLLNMYMKEYCKKTFATQIKIKEAHEKFSHKRN